MSDTGMGWYSPLPGVIYGTANPATDSDPHKRAALQEASWALRIQLSKAPGAVPRSYEHPGTGNPPTLGWTAQNAAGRAPFPPYTAQGTGRLPDWTGDLGQGPYDMTSPVATGDYNPLNRGPIGVPFWDAPGADIPPNPNTLYDIAGTIGQDLEW